MSASTATIHVLPARRHDLLTICAKQFSLGIKTCPRRSTDMFTVEAVPAKMVAFGEWLHMAVLHCWARV